MLRSLFIKKRLQDRYFLVNTAKYIRIDFFNRTPLMAASEFKSNISKVNLIKAKRSYFYILIIATQTKQILMKRYDFFIHC